MELGGKKIKGKFIFLFLVLVLLIFLIFLLRRVFYHPLYKGRKAGPFYISRVFRGITSPFTIHEDFKGSLDNLEGLTVRMIGEVKEVKKKGKIYLITINHHENIKVVVFPERVSFLEEKGFFLKGIEGKRVEIRGKFQNHPVYGEEIILEDGELLEE